MGIRIVTPEEDDLRFTVQLECSLSNNKAEYYAVLKTIQMLIVVGAENVVMFTNSQLVAQQILGKFEVKKKKCFDTSDRSRRLQLDLPLLI